MGRLELKRIMAKANDMYRGGHYISYVEVAKMLDISQREAQKKIEYLAGPKKQKLVLMERDRTGKGLYAPKKAEEHRVQEIDDASEQARLLGYLKRAEQIPAQIHDMQLATKITEEEYHWMKLHAQPIHKVDPGNNKQILIYLSIPGPKPRDSVATRLTAQISSTGTVSIYSRLTQTPFTLRDNSDIYRIAQTLGEWRRALITTGGLPSTLPEVDRWVLQRVDINKDIPISKEDARRSNFWLSIEKAYESFVAYVKYLKDEGRVLRVENRKTYLTEPTIIEACEGILDTERHTSLEQRVLEAHESNIAAPIAEEPVDAFYPKVQTAKQMLDSEER